MKKEFCGLSQKTEDQEEKAFLEDISSQFTGFSSYSWECYLH